jgi:hypothetical protein
MGNLCGSPKRDIDFDRQQAGNLKRANKTNNTGVPSAKMELDDVKPKEFSTKEAFEAPAVAPEGETHDAEAAAAAEKIANE